MRSWRRSRYRSSRRARKRSKKRKSRSRTKRRKRSKSRTKKKGKKRSGIASKAISRIKENIRRSYEQGGTLSKIDTTLNKVMPPGVLKHAFWAVPMLLVLGYLIYAMKNRSQTDKIPWILEALDQQAVREYLLTTPNWAAAEIDRLRRFATQCMDARRRESQALADLAQAQNGNGGAQFREGDAQARLAQARHDIAVSCRVAEDAYMNRVNHARANASDHPGHSLLLRPFSTWQRIRRTLPDGLLGLVDYFGDGGGAPD